MKYDYKKHKNLDNLPDTFTIDEKEYSIKNFLAHIRANHKKYISNENSKGSNSPTAIRRYQALDEMTKAEDEKKLFLAIDSLNKKEREIIKLHYGFYDGRKYSMEKIAEIIGHNSRERIRQIEAKALRKLRHPTRSKKLKDFMDS